MHVRFGIIGPGHIADRFANALSMVEDVSLTAVASSSSLARAKSFAEKFGAKQAYLDYSDLLKDDQVDVVYIGVTHNFHFETIKLCLNHGKGVICEKPMTVSKQEMEEIISLAAQKKVLLMEAMWTRFLPAFRKAREWVESKTIGEIKLVQASFCFNAPFNPENRLFNPDLAGGSLLDAGVYPIEFASGILGENPSDAAGFLKLCETGVDEFSVISLKFPSGALASISSGITASTSKNAYIYGTRGHIIVYDFLGTKKSERFDHEGKLVESYVAEDIDGFVYQIKHFADLFRHGQIESDLMPHQDNLACTAVFDVLLKDKPYKI